MNDEIESLLGDLSSGDDPRAELAADRLSAIGNEITPALINKLESKDPDNRWWAIRTLAQMDTPPMDLLISSLEDVSQEVQQCATLAICHHPDNRAIPVLLKLLIDSETVSCNLAATALIAIGKESIPELLELLPNLKELSRIEAIRAFACIEDHRAIPVLMTALDENSVVIYYWAEEGLNRLGLGMVYFQPE